MKKSTIELVENRFTKDIEDINYKIRKNKEQINKLAEEQRNLKDTRKGLCDILHLIKNS